MTGFPRRFLLPALILALGLSACATPPRNANPLIVTSEALSDLDEALRYSQRIKKLSGAELTKEYEQLSQAFSQTKSDLSRVQLALLLSSPNAVFRDDAAAVNLLKDWPKENPKDTPKENKVVPNGLRAFGMLLASLLEEIREHDKRADALQKKLDAIKSMEKNLMQRDKP